MLFALCSKICTYPCNSDDQIPLTTKIRCQIQKTHACRQLDVQLCMRVWCVCGECVSVIRICMRIRGVLHLETIREKGEELAPFRRERFIWRLVVCKLCTKNQTSAPNLQNQMSTTEINISYYEFLPTKINSSEWNNTSPMMGLSEKAFTPSWNFGAILFTCSTIFLSLQRYKRNFTYFYM